MYAHPVSRYGRSLQRVGSSRLLYKAFHRRPSGALYSPIARDRNLNRAGQSASVKGQLILCRNGYHAGTAEYVKTHHGHCPVVFRVKLEDVWKDDWMSGGKYVGRKVTLLYRVRWDGKRYVRVTPARKGK